MRHRSNLRLTYSYITPHARAAARPHAGASTSFAFSCSISVKTIRSFFRPQLLRPGARAARSEGERQQVRSEKLVDDDWARGYFKSASGLRLAAALESMSGKRGSRPQRQRQLWPRWNPATNYHP